MHDFIYYITKLLSFIWYAHDASSKNHSQKHISQKAKEQQKKQLRKAKQLFRKLTMAAYQAANPNDNSIGNDAVWDDLEKMNDDVSIVEIVLLA